MSQNGTLFKIKAWKKSIKKDRIIIISKKSSSFFTESAKSRQQREQELKTRFNLDFLINLAYF